MSSSKTSSPATPPPHRDRGRVTLRTFALASLASLLGDAPPQSAEAGWLRGCLDAVDAAGAGWASELLEYLSNPHPADGPLLGLAGDLALSATEMLAASLAAAVEDDPMAGRAMAHLQAPLGGSRPTLGLLSLALADTVPSGSNPIDALASGPAAGSGLLRLPGEGLPLPERSLEVPGPVSLALRGVESAWPGTVVGTTPDVPVSLPPSALEEARRQGAALSSVGTAARRVLVVRSGSPLERKAAACAIGEAVGRRVAFIDGEQVQGLAPWLLLRGLLPAFSFDLGPGERRMLPEIPFYSGPALALCGPDGTVESPEGTALSWTLPVPVEEERRELWRAALGDEQLAAALAQDYRHPSGRIAELGRLAHHHSILEGRQSPRRDDVVAASWSGEGAGLDALAQPLRDSVPDEALVMSPTLRRDMDLLLLRCRSRDRLVRGLGVSATARYHPGVRALLVGPSGTGKTLAAGWLATRLGLPLYRVDLASVTSKYIGETEKNLAQLLARAEQAEVVLLFDEADALFGKRTDVKEANDRFANSQTNYLLQRIESFYGITLLTSNSRSRFDTAFSRRLDMIVEFPLPGPEERRALWQSHLGDQHGLTAPELNRLAAASDLSGGHIRNVVLTAAVLAQEGGRPIQFSDILEGLAGEYRKLGQQLPQALARGA